MQTRNIESLATGLAAAGLLALAPQSAWEAAGAQQSRPTVADAVAEMLRDGLDLEDVTVSVAGTEATLAGSVPTLWDKTEAIERTLAFPQVETVASELTVPEVEDDNEIAREVGRAIRNYRYITIWDYVGGGVENGVVTLNDPERGNDVPRQGVMRQRRVPQGTGGDRHAQPVVAARRRLLRDLHPDLLDAADSRHPLEQLRLPDRSVAAPRAVSWRRSPVRRSSRRMS